jgi:hypothetical protein
MPADSMCSIAQCTRTELPQNVTTLNWHEYGKRASRGTIRMVAGLADNQRVVCRVADTRGFPSSENGSMADQH